MDGTKLILTINSNTVHLISVSFIFLSIFLVIGMTQVSYHSNSFLYSSCNFFFLDFVKIESESPPNDRMTKF